METANLPKIDPKKIDEYNSSHTKNEWGMTQDDLLPKKIRVIEAYTVIWDDQPEHRS